MDKPNTIAPPLADYFLTLQPGYENNDPTDGLFNHVWILGGADAISAASQDRIDAASALVPVDKQPGQ